MCLVSIQTIYFNNTLIASKKLFNSVKYFKICISKSFMRPCFFIHLLTEKPFSPENLFHQTPFFFKKKTFSNNKFFNEYFFTNKIFSPKNFVHQKTLSTKKLHSPKNFFSPIKCVNQKNSQKNYFH